MSSLFLGCFAFGLIFTVASFVLGAFVDSPIGHSGHGAGAHGHGGADHHGGSISPFNLSTISAFLTWFGGTGYLLSRYSGFTTVLITLFASAVGVIGAGIVFAVLTRFILPRLSEMRPADYQVEGAVGRVTGLIRAGGTGEIVVTLGGHQQIESARGVNDEEFEKGTEVVIHHVAAGIAYVERWDKFAEKHALPPGSPGPS